MANEVIAIAIDVPTPPEDQKRAIPVQFLGHQIPLLPGCVTLAQMTGAQILVLVMSRSADWSHQVLEILPVALDGSVISTFQRCMAIVEEPIRHNPAYWNGWENFNGLVELGLLPH